MFRIANQIQVFSFFALNTFLYYFLSLFTHQRFLKKVFHLCLLGCLQTYAKQLVLCQIYLYI